MNRIACVVASLAAVAVLAGCGLTRSQPYVGQDVDQVWSAMKAVAESPDYDDWHLLDNEVYADESRRRIELMRVIRRKRHVPDEVTSVETRELLIRYQISDDDPPTIKATNRRGSPPGHFWAETDRYFADIADILGVSLEPPEEAPEEAPETDPETDPADEDATDPDGAQSPEHPGDHPGDHPSSAGGGSQSGA